MSKFIQQLLTIFADIRRNISVLEKAVHAKEFRLLARMLRSTGNIRKRISPDMLARVISCYVPDSYPHKSAMLKPLDSVPKKSDSMEIDTKPVEKTGEGTNETEEKKMAPNANYDLLATPSPAQAPEVLMYLHLLTVIVLLDGKCLNDAVSVSKALIESLAKYNRRTMDEINSRAYFYYVRSIELTGSVASIRSSLLAAYRTATLRNDSATQAVLLNLLLRNYIQYSLYTQADMLLNRAKFPATRSNNQLARFLYYTGRIKAMQLLYTEAYWNLQQAMRKAPQNTALGFRISTQKFMIIVQLLTGEVPPRDIFRQPQMQKALRPYLKITQAVREGDMQKFKNVLEASAEEFETDRTMSLIIRLRHSVIKTGLRMLSTSYSRISLAEVSKRLHLDSPENAEGVVAKAIHDGVIDAVIDHAGGFLRSNERTDVYSTIEPTDTYHTRIQFCLNIYNDAVKAMRFPEKRDEDDTPEQRRERLKEQEELAKTLADEEDDDYEP